MHSLIVVDDDTIADHNKSLSSCSIGHVTRYFTWIKSPFVSGCACAAGICEVISGDVAAMRSCRVNIVGWAERIAQSCYRFEDYCGKSSCSGGRRVDCLDPSRVLRRGAQGYPLRRGTNGGVTCE